MNSENRTLIAYATKGGATQKISNQIAQVLRTKYGLQVDEVNLAKQGVPNLASYNNIVVGTGVRKGAIYEETLQFLNRDFTGKHTAYFTCSGFIYPKSYDETVLIYTKNVLTNYPQFRPIATEAFGGYIKILGLPIARKMNSDKIESWAEQLGKTFSKSL
ncbi:MAG TPA: flavodoxin domain-containing protein [Candidatus Sulfotelmatobacter sp.]|nr:flavodoxin domain-containing protein [Candidatus Sulfotelmatobacter sp.]